MSTKKDIKGRTKNKNENEIRDTHQKTEALDILSAIVTEDIRQRRARDVRLDAVYGNLVPVLQALVMNYASKVSPSSHSKSAAEAILVELYEAFEGFSESRLASFVSSGLFNEKEIGALLCALSFVSKQREASVKPHAPGKPNGSDEPLQ